MLFYSTNMAMKPSFKNLNVLNCREMGMNCRNEKKRAYTKFCPFSVLTQSVGVLPQFVGVLPQFVGVLLQLVGVLLQLVGVLLQLVGVLPQLVGVLLQLVGVLTFSYFIIKPRNVTPLILKTLTIAYY